MANSPWGPIIAALIAGFIAFIGMVATKENKTSEFRQAWILELRALLSHYMYLIDIIRSSSFFYDNEIREAKKDLIKVIADITLHLNHANPSKEEENLIILLGKMRLDSTIENNDTNKGYEEFISAGHAVLKAEWNRVKSGEMNYIAIKNVLFLVAVICVSTLIISFVTYFIKISGI